MPGPEDRVVAACVRELDKRRIPHININGSNGDTGLPDRFAFPGRGVTLAIETKAPKTGRLSAKQRHWHKRLRDAGITVLVVDDVKQLRTWLDHHDHGDRDATA